MPPDGYTTVTITEETEAKLYEIMADTDVDSLSEAVEYAADVARDPETLSAGTLARVLHERLSG